MSPVFPYLFTGRRFDAESGLYYFRNRYYSPLLGKFISPDPLDYVDGMNVYAYVNGNTANLVDPLGLMAWWETCLENSANFAAGAADKLTGGTTDRLREGLGINEQVNHESNAYIAGEVTGVAIEAASLATGVSALAKSGVKLAVTKGAAKASLMVAGRVAKTVVIGKVAAIAVDVGVDQAVKAEWISEEAGQDIKDVVTIARFVLPVVSMVKARVSLRKPKPPPRGLETRGTRPAAGSRSMTKAEYKAMRQQQRLRSMTKAEYKAMRRQQRLGGRTPAEARAASQALKGGPKPKAGSGAAPKSGTPRIHGNSLNSPNPNHAYVIVDTKTGKMMKPGISGQPLLKSGASPRANRQLSALNKGQPGRYKAVIVEQNVSRPRALEIEQMITDKHAARNAGQMPSPIHRRPRPQVQSRQEFLDVHGVPHNRPQGGRY